nr:uncharacterized protein LOC105319101 isoform X2 [Crassostrea gigas]
MKTFLFLFVACITWNRAIGIYGGCMSYSTSHTDVAGQFQVKIYFLNGWKLNRGPCYNCTEKDEGSDVTERRKQYIIDKNDPEVFGSWSYEKELKGTQVSTPVPLTLKINRQIRDVVLMVNEHEGWELESSEINLLVDMNTADKHRFDIMFTNSNDGDLTDMVKGVEVFLQVKVDPYIRTDTKKPNSSPVVLVKPYYSLEHGKIHTLHIPAVDDDDDKSNCEFSTWVEAGFFEGIVRNLTSASIIAMKDIEDCVFTINLNNSRFSVGDTFALPITVKDYGRKYAVTVTGHTAYKTPLGRVNVLMFFKVTGRTDPPKFIPPTPPNNQAYTVYVGGDFNVSVYAKPTVNDRNISKFNFLRRDGIHVQQTTMKSVPGDPTAVYISMGWSPLNGDIGKHIVCANAEDSNGISTVELHCFKIDVKANIIRPNPAIQGKPYYASFPKQQDILCPLYSYCRFPIYAATYNIGGVRQIISTDHSQENVTIQYSSDVINGTLETKVAQVEFLALTPGPRQICLNATDRYDWTVRCLIVTVERQDPCESIPCQNNGICTAFKDKTGFKCTCDEKHNGTFCEEKINFCKNSTCLNSENCMMVAWKPYFLCQQCPPGKTRDRCDVDINLCSPTTCNENQICQQQDQSVYQCLTGTVRQHCPNNCLKSEGSICVNNQCVCALRPKLNEMCITNETHRSNNNNPYFTEPTPSSGSVITCDFYERNCEFPVYIFSTTFPELTVFNGMNELNLFGRKISFSHLEKNSDGVYFSITSLSKSQVIDPKHHEIDLCLNVAKLTSPQHITDKRCFHVVDRGVPPVQQSITNLNQSCIFAKPTLPRESTVGCRKGQSCHFYLYSGETHGQCSIVTTNDPSTGIFDPKISLGLCRYEVAYTNTSTVGIDKICFLICSRGESRCFQMHTNDIVDQCAIDPCLNNAYCQTESTGEFRCHCREGFWGKHCENGFCNQSYCKNDAVCFTSNGNRGCFCRLGLEGSNCALHINRDLTDTNENGGHFTHVGLIESVTCYISEPCTMPISITRNIHAMPVLEVGFSDKTLKVQTIDLDSSTHPGGIVHGTLTVVGYELGLKRICLDSVSNPRTARIEDEICFQINVTKGNILEPDEANPYFVNPTLPTTTVLQCVVNQQCYLNLWARNRVGIEKCPQLEVDKTIEDGVYIFPLRDSTNQPCVFESVILIDNVTDIQLCFSLPLDSSSENIANVQKDTRCYIIRLLPEVTVKGSCAGMSCYNEGFCDGSSPSSQCLCRSGFSEYNCSKDFGIAQAFNSCTSSQAKFGDVALPTLIRCPLFEICDIPFSVTDTSNLNSFNVTWNGTNFESVNISLSQMSGSRDFTGNAVVVHNATGKHEFCLTLGIRAYAYDSVCCFVLTEPAIVPQLPDNRQSLFISPSPSNNSEFSCTAGQPCHVTFRTSTGDDQNCPELQNRSRMPVHIFTALSPNECQRDVLIESQNSTQGTEKYCFQTSSSGILGEVRCMTIHFENHGLPPPPPTTTTTESPTTVIPSTTTTSSATSDNDHTTTSDNDHTTTSNTVSTSLPGNGPESTTNKEISTRQTEQLASKETTLILGSVQTIATLGTAQTTQIQPEQTKIALETGQQATTLVTGKTTTTLAAVQMTTTLGAGQTTTTLAAGQTSTLGSDQTTTTLAAEQKTQTTMPAAGQTKTTLGGQTTTTLAAGQTTTTLAAKQTTQLTMPAAGETTTLAAGQTTTTLAAGQTTTALAAEQTTQTTMPAARQTTTTLAAGQTTTTLAAGQTTTTLAAEQTTQTTIPAAGKTTTTLAAGQTTQTLAAGQTTTTLTAEQTTTLAAGQTTTLAAEQTTQTTMPAAGETTTTLAAGQTATTFATGKTITTTQHKRETCDVVAVQEWAKKGRVKCECFHPTGGTTTTVIAKNPHVSGKSLMVAAGLGSGAMVTMLGTGVLLYAVSQKYFGPRKTGPGSDTNQQKKKLSVASCPDKKQLH